jgi:hypothetical protein
MRRSPHTARRKAGALRRRFPSSVEITSSPPIDVVQRDPAVDCSALEPARQQDPQREWVTAGRPGNAWIPVLVATCSGVRSQLRQPFYASDSTAYVA